MPSNPGETTESLAIADRLKRAKIVIAVLVAAVVLLSSLSIGLWGLSQHYHDSKYRAQYVLVRAFANATAEASATLQYLVDPTQSYSNQGIASDLAWMRLKQAHSASDAIGAMYPRGGREAAAFNNLSRGVYEMEWDMTYVRGWFIGSEPQNYSYPFSSATTALFNESIAELLLLSIVAQSGVDSSRNWYSEPYSLVNRMDLSSIQEMGTHLEDTCHQLEYVLGFGGPYH